MSRQGLDYSTPALSFTDDMLEMIPVPFEGSESFNPHNEAMASEYGAMLLDIPDVAPKRQPTPVPGAKTQQGDLFA